MVPMFLIKSPSSNFDPVRKLTSPPSTHCLNSVLKARAEYYVMEGVLIWGEKYYIKKFRLCLIQEGRGFAGVSSSAPNLIVGDS